MIASLYHCWAIVVGYHWLCLYQFDLVQSIHVPTMGCKYGCAYTGS